MFVLCMLFGPASSDVAQQADKAAIKKVLSDIDAATAKGDFASVAKFTNEKIIEANGGLEKYTEVISNVMRSMEAQGIKIISHAFDEPEEPFVVGEQVVSIVKELTIMTKQNQKIEIIGYQLATRKKSGGPWLIVGGGGLAQNPAALPLLVPGIPKDFKLPAYSMRVVP